MKVLSSLPSEFWRGSIGMTEERSAIGNMEVTLRRVFGDRSRKEISMLTVKRRAVYVNVVRTTTGKRRN